MNKEDELEKEMDALIATPPLNQNFGTIDLRRPIGLLGKAVIRLDKTSGFLSKVNIGLTVVILIVGIVQVYLMLKGH